MATGEAPKTAIEHFNRSAESYEKYTAGCTREVAQYILRLPDLADAGSPGTVVLDNACGTAIVTEEIIQRRRQKETETATIHAVDAAPNMVDMARRKIEGLNTQHCSVTTQVMPGEHLSFENDTFTHSITNLGIPFYQDGLAGPRRSTGRLSPAASPSSRRGPTWATSIPS
jgi:ubiquinone/menaquinone biosynthesis C-methylase UbiE